MIHFSINVTAIFLKLATSSARERKIKGRQICARGGGDRRLTSKKSMRTRAESGSEPIRDYRAVGARARCAFTRALNTVNALSGTTSLLSPPSSDRVVTETRQLFFSLS